MTPATDWKEIVPEGEAERLEKYAVALRDMQRRKAAAGKTSRALHAKGNSGVAAELTVLPGLPEYARIGIFAEPATYQAYVRYSNGAASHQHDGRGDVRGLAVKVVGVPGKKIIPGLEAAKTQDFLLIRTPSTPFPDAADFVAFVLAVEKPLLALPRILGSFGFGRGTRLLKQLARSLTEPITSMATMPYYSALPVKYGPYAVHYALFPHASPKADAKKGSTPHYLGEDLSARLREGPVSYDFKVQFYVDAAKTPIEDASVEWLPGDAPFLTVARLVLPQQDTASPRGRRLAAAVEGFSFDPWHTTEDFRPLGNMMRARNHAYRLSTQERHASPEPDGTETFD
jgi:hypothetical protein